MILFNASLVIFSPNLNFKNFEACVIFFISISFAFIPSSVTLNKLINSCGCLPHLSNKSYFMLVSDLKSAVASFLYIFNLSTGEGR